jgi:hypothetical protein
LDKDPHDNAIIKTVLIHNNIKFTAKNYFPFEHRIKQINPMVELNQKDLKKSKTFIKVKNRNLSNENIEINNSKDEKFYVNNEIKSKNIKIIKKQLTKKKENEEKDKVLSILDNGTTENLMINKINNSKINDILDSREQRKKS